MLREGVSCLEQPAHLAISILAPGWRQNLDASEIVQAHRRLAQSMLDVGKHPTIRLLNCQLEVRPQGATNKPDAGDDRYVPRQKMATME